MLGHTFKSFFVKGFVAISNLFFIFVISKNLNVVNSSNFFLMHTILILLPILIFHGLDYYIIRFGARYKELKEFNSLNLLYKNSIKRTLLISIVSVIIIIASHILFTGYQLETYKIFMIFSVVPYSLLFLNLETGRAIGAYYHSPLFMGCIIPLAIVIFWYLSTIDDFYSIDGLSKITFFVYFTLMLLSFIWIKKKLQKLTKNNYKNNSFSFDNKTLFNLFAVNGMQQILIYVPFLTVAVFGISSDLSAYYVSLRLSLIITFFVQAINIVLAPKLSSFFSKGEISSFKVFSKFSSLIGIITALPIYIIFMIFGLDILNLFGDSYQESFYILILLSTAQFINAGVGSVIYILIMSGYEKLLRNINFITLAICLLIAPILIQNYGSLGAAYLNTFIIIFVNFASLMIIRIRLNFWVTPNLSFKILKSLLTNKI